VGLINVSKNVAQDVPEKYKLEIANSNWTALDSQANAFVASMAV
jgi:hypothetical protein